MSLVTIENPLTRLSILPNGMNWRGGWSATEQYYKNDVVVSNINQSSYILTGATTSYGGDDPTTNPLWVELSSQTTGVASVNAGTGISITGDQGTPIVNAVNIYSNIQITAPSTENGWTGLGTQINIPATNYGGPPPNPTSVTPVLMIAGKVWDIPDMLNATEGIYRPTSYNISFAIEGYGSGVPGDSIMLKFMLYSWDGTTNPVLLDTGMGTFVENNGDTVVFPNKMFYFQTTLNQLTDVLYDTTTNPFIYLEIYGSAFTLASGLSFTFNSSNTVSYYNYLKVVTTRLGEAIPFPPP